MLNAQPLLHIYSNCLENLRRLFWRSCFLYNLESNSLHSNQSFIAGLGNLRRWQEEAVLPTVLKLKCERVFDAKVVCPIIRTTRSQVWRTENLSYVWDQLNQPCLKKKIIKTTTYILFLLQNHICRCFYNIFWFSEQLLGPSQACKKKNAFIKTCRKKNCSLSPFRINYRHLHKFHAEILCGLINWWFCWSVQSTHQLFVVFYFI